MKPNVHIVARERGKIVARREGHNVFVDNGRQFLAELMSLESADPDAIERNDRIKSIGLGIGGIGQTYTVEVSAAPFTTYYSVGNDPHGTTGAEYNHDFPISPLITTLERPVKIDGSLSDYPGQLGDQWLSAPSAPQTIITKPSATSRNIHAFFDGAAGDFLLGGTFSYMPFSEAGLFTSTAYYLHSPYQELVAYHNFDTILYTADTELEVIWTVSF